MQNRATQQLKAYRAANGLDNVALAARCGVPSATLNGWLYLNKIPRPARVEALDKMGIVSASAWFERAEKAQANAG